jgi:hypothetical protein
MQDVIDEALQRLYWACREGRGFPGEIPDESGGRVSTDAILRGLGLSPPPMDNSRGSGTQSDSILDTQARVTRDSYHPPDMPRAHPASAPPAASGSSHPSATPSERVSTSSGTPGAALHDPGGTVMDLDGGEEESEEDEGEAFAGDLSQSFRHGLGGEAHGNMPLSLDPAMMQGGQVEYLSGPMYASNVVYGSGFSVPGQQMTMHDMNQFAVSSLSSQLLPPTTDTIGIQEQLGQGGLPGQISDATLAWQSGYSSNRRDQAQGRE